ncbi:GNAT family N-acetyltransferase [Desulfogranum japonicum]|uniref:GNAT family N-acetyltransferase n=1 Tax=Desulfogranum japonicum TaxID=231447 RepID=UPI000404254B|nr:N-acetyltransferase [Desulfogranum japonicum]
MDIREANKQDVPAILQVHQKAFGEDKGTVISRLVNDLFQDTTAKPSYSFIANDKDTIVGHILFTHVNIEGTGSDIDIPAQILAPLAVLPEHQNQGVGIQLIHAGIDALRKYGIKLVFVLGHPGYYPRCGFIPAGSIGFEAPYPIPPEHSEAWMVQELCPGILDQVKGKVVCSVTLNQPEHWRE